MGMGAAVLHRESDRPANTDPNKRLEFSLDEIEYRRTSPDQSASMLVTNRRLLRCVDQARLAHGRR